jgi:multiple sugar transport system permease protein
MFLVREKRIVRFLYGVILAAGLLFVFLPFTWLLVTSLKLPVDAFTLPPVWIFKPTMVNYLQIVRKGFMKAYRNSVVIAALSTLISLLLGVPAGYSLARARFRGRTVMGTYILLSRLAPPVIFCIPLYVVFRNLRLIDTFTGLTISYLTITLPFVVWLMTSFFKGVPVELEEAAIIDGCSRAGALARIVLPVSVPGVSTAFIFSMLMSWNQYFYPLILGGRRTTTAPLMVQSFVSFEGLNWGQLAAAGLVVVVPVFAFTLIAQKGVIRGLTGGALK